MSKHKVTLLLVTLLIVGCQRNSHHGALEVTYIGNEGFMIAMASTKVLIDCFPDSKYYVNPSDSLVAMMMDGLPPFDNIDYVLVTHDHPDHFNAGIMSRYLLRHPAVHFIASTETCSELGGDSLAAWRQAGVSLERGRHETIKGDKAEITVFRLDHGGYRDITNLAYYVRANGCAFVHVGDARLSENQEFLQRMDWSGHDIDLLFIEHFDRGSEAQAIVQDLIQPKHVVLMHIPRGEENAVRNSDEKIHPRTVVFEKENEMRRFDDL